MKNENANLDKLVVLWTSGNREVALKMVLRYTLNAKKREWWKDICLIIWGPSSKLLSEDLELQEYITQIKEAGVKIEACKGCTDDYGISSKLEEFGIDVKYMGLPFTEYLKNDCKVITF